MYTKIDIHGYVQNTITYVQKYDRPDLFIRLTCNPAWNEIKELLLLGQTPIDRHDITAHAFKEKTKGIN